MAKYSYKSCCPKHHVLLFDKSKYLEVLLLWPEVYVFLSFSVIIAKFSSRKLLLQQWKHLRGAEKPLEACTDHGIL